MKLSELKAAVYRLAQVDTTKQLKAKYKDIKPLDMRRKASWEKALVQLQAVSKSEQSSAGKALVVNLPAPQKSASKKASSKKSKPKKKKVRKSAARELVSQQPADSVNVTEGFDAWVSNPPSDFAALFAEADEALGAFDKKLAKTKKLTKTAITMAHSLEEFAEASLSEAEHLKDHMQRVQERAKEADLN
ncbi:MAG: hypothetical protein AAFQ74_10590 [Cyanobacteria bacterium J06623_4]